MAGDDARQKWEQLGQQIAMARAELANSTDPARIAALRAQIRQWVAERMALSFQVTR